MLIEAGRLKFYISPAFALFFALTANTVAGKTYIIVLIFSLIHESMHIILLFLSGIKTAFLRFGAGGISMEADGFNLLSYKKTVLCTIIPPVLNIASGGICYLVFLYTENPMLYEAANAKINLFLDVTGLRPDGYHNLHSCMQTVDLCDTIRAEILPASETTIRLTCSDSSLPADESNLAWRAASLFLTEQKITDCDLRLHVDKRIPMSAGLGGGSADAAAVQL